jgi:hypothetical protein
MAICEHCKAEIDSKQTSFSFGSEDRKAQRSQIFNALRKARSQGCTNVELNKICFRYGGRIHELRNDGHKIITKKEGELYRYTLAPESW